jgi:hypothetical protein
VTSIYADGGYFSAIVRDLAGVIPLEFNDEFVWKADPAGFPYVYDGYFQIYDVYDRSNPDGYVNGYLNLAYGYFNITRATVTRLSVEPPPPPPSPVPLPASGALLLGAALGLAGLRRRRAR